MDFDDQTPSHDDVWTSATPQAPVADGSIQEFGGNPAPAAGGGAGDSAAVPFNGLYGAESSFQLTPPNPTLAPPKPTLRDGDQSPPEMPQSKPNLLPSPADVVNSPPPGTTTTQPPPAGENGGVKCEPDASRGVAKGDVSVGGSCSATQNGVTVQGSAGVQVNNTANKPGVDPQPTGGGQVTVPVAPGVKCGVYGDVSGAGQNPQQKKVERTLSIGCESSN